MNDTKIVLASGSPRRTELLTRMGIQHEVITSTVDEASIPADHPRTFALRAAFAKASDVASRVEEGSLVIAADTVVTKNSVLYGKPADDTEAAEILMELSGKPHDVVTGVAIARAGSPEVRMDSDTTQVFLRELSAAEIRAYIETGSPLDKAGAYGIQDTQANVVEQIEGSYFNVVGFPCSLVANMLKEFGWSHSVNVPETPQRWRR